MWIRDALDDNEQEYSTPVIELVYGFFDHQSFLKNARCLAKKF